jgi:phosphatidylglycerol---prolipoprotein diacylglyceryl transferase
LFCEKREKGLNGFSLLLAVGAGMGLAQVLRSAPKGQANRWLNAALLAWFAGLVGARLGYVLLNLSYFSGHWSEAPAFSSGGLTWPGAVLGMMLALPFFRIETPRGAKKIKAPFAQAADLLALMVPPAAVMAWLGCWQAGSAYGPLAPIGAWWGISVVDEAGAAALRWPLQPLAALALTVCFGLLQMNWKKNTRPGLFASLTGLILAGVLLPCSLLVVEPAPLYNGLRAETWGALFLALVSLLAAGMIIVKPARSEAYSTGHRI